MDSVHLELQYKWQIRRSPVFFCSSWNLVHRRRFRKLQARLCLETDTDPKRLWPQKTKEQNQKTKETKNKNKTKPTKNCSLLIDCFPAAKKNHNQRKLSGMVTQSVLCTKDDRARPARLDQTRPAASSRCSLHHFSSKTISTRRQFFLKKSPKTRSIGRFKIKNKILQQHRSCARNSARRLSRARNLLSRPRDDVLFPSKMRASLPSVPSLPTGPVITPGSLLNLHPLNYSPPPTPPHPTPPGGTFHLFTVLLLFFRKNPKYLKLINICYHKNMSSSPGFIYLINF
jgi:hypothetical protein